ncbi:MAG: hypothetical protein LBU09_02340 [Endomicrobium sp.]|jgi:hypothetical protein|nr:hypothetical protein [Endomicrobium sp.]
MKKYLWFVSYHYGEGLGSVIIETDFEKMTVVNYLKLRKLLERKDESRIILNYKKLDEE